MNRGDGRGTETFVPGSQEYRPSERAREWQVPYVRLLDAAGGSVRGFEQIGRTYLPDGNAFTLPDVELLNTVPVVSAVMGSVAGLPAVNACMTHWNVMVEGTSQTNVAAGSKAMRLMQLCDTFHLPLISLADEPGFHVGVDSEKEGIERAGARMVATTCMTRMPWLTVVLRRLYGVAGQCHHRPTGMFRRYCWPSARWGSMHIAGGAAAAYRREIESADDPEVKRREIEDRLNALASPFRTAEATGQDIIDPAETRPLLAEFVADAQRVLAGQLGPPVLPYLP